MSYNYAGVLLGVLINQEQDNLLHGTKGTNGLLEKYGQSLHEDERYERFGVPSYAQHAGPDYLGFFLFTGGEKLIQHYRLQGMVKLDEFKVERLPDSAMEGLHLAGLLDEAVMQWLAFVEFCSKQGVEFPLPKLFLVVDRE